MPTATCAVVGCENAAKPQVCPFCDRRHQHGCIHYDGISSVLALTMRPDGWYWICDEHYEAIVSAMSRQGDGDRHTAALDAEGGGA